MYQQADRLRHNFLTVSGVHGTLRRLTIFSLRRRNTAPLSSTSSERADFVDNLVPCPSKCLATRISVRSPSFLARTKKGLLRGALQGLHLLVPSIVRCVSCIVLADLQLYVGKLRQPRVCNIYNITPTREVAGQTIHVNRTWTVHINKFGYFRCRVSKACKSPMVLPAPIQCSTHAMSFSLPNPPTFHAPN